MIAVAATDRFRVPQKPAVDASAGSVPYRGVTTAGQVVPGLFKLSGTPTRNHIHTVVRTPNGNDYGRDLLRQHLQQHRH